MDSEVKLYLQRAQNELNLARIIMLISKNSKIQTETFKLLDIDTYFSAVISHSYYAIFYSAKAYLTNKNIKIFAPEEHKKTLEQFERLVEIGAVDKELLKIYKEVLVKAEELLGIFHIEKNKRERFTYQRVAQANEEPARNSIENAETFFKNIWNLCEK